MARMKVSLKELNDDIARLYRTLLVTAVIMITLFVAVVATACDRTMDAFWRNDITWGIIGLFTMGSVLIVFMMVLVVVVLPTLLELDECKSQRTVLLFQKSLEALTDSQSTGTS